MVIALISICLWISGGILLFQENNGKIIILITAVAILARIKSQINKDRKVSSGL